MGISCDSELRHMPNYCHELTTAFVFQMKDGSFFRIDNIAVDEHPTLKRRARKDSSFEVKFVTIDDPEIDGTETINQYMLKFFPMYDRYGDEITHGSMSEGDSILNGNIVITDGKVEKCTTNYCDRDYEEIESKVREFAGDFISQILERHI